jgi:hypothetical protein
MGQIAQDLNFRPLMMMGLLMRTVSRLNMCMHASLLPAARARLHAPIDRFD